MTPNARDQPPPFAVGCIAWLDSDDFIKALHDLRNFLG
jgi:hypothetical protein